MPVESVSSQQRAAVIRRAAGTCEYCRCQGRYTSGPYTVDHIIPKARGGKNRLTNLAYACSSCNGHKHTKVTGTDPLTGQSAPLFHPRRQKWEQHFAWDEGFTLIVGLTAIGRATVVALLLNREEAINIREALRILNRHPPV